MLAMPLAILALAILSPAARCAPTIVRARISGPGEAGYELVVYGQKREGRLGPAAVGDSRGATAYETVELGEADVAVPAVLTFYLAGAPPAACAPVVVPLDEFGPACLPVFLAREAGAGASWDCESRCDSLPRPETGRRGVRGLANAPGRHNRFAGPLWVAAEGLAYTTPAKTRPSERANDKKGGLR